MRMSTKDKIYNLVIFGTYNGFVSHPPIKTFHFGTTRAVKIKKKDK